MSNFDSYVSSTRVDPRFVWPQVNFSHVWSPLTTCRNTHFFFENMIFMFMNSTLWNPWKPFFMGSLVGPTRNATFTQKKQGALWREVVNHLRAQFLRGEVEITEVFDFHLTYCWPKFRLGHHPSEKMVVGGIWDPTPPKKAPRMQV